LSAGDPKTYELLVGKVRAKHAIAHEAAFKHFLRELFTAIARVSARGPLEPEPLELPDPVSFRRLEFEPNGTMRIHDSPLRAGFEQLYRDLVGLDGTRIRECADCGELFWAQRKDRVGCSKPCANRLRFSRYYGLHKKSGIRSHRRQMPPSPPNPALATFQSRSRAAKRSAGFDGHIPDQPPALCNLPIDNR
jgi:hypothetical protein